MVKISSIGFEPLRTILNMECERGYNNTAVIGGLDRYLNKWATEFSSKVQSPELMERFKELKLPNTNYAGWSGQQREQWIYNFIKWLDDLGNQNNPVSPGKVKSDLDVNAELDLPIDVMKGIKSNTATKFSKLGIKTVRDILYFFPRRHIDYSQQKHIAELSIDSDAGEQTVIAHVWEARVVRLGGQIGTEVTLGDETGNIRAVWFNQPYLAKRFLTNTKLVISGKCTLFKGQKVFESPEWEVVNEQELIHTGRLVPVYPLTRGLYSRQVRSLVKTVIDRWSGKVPDYLPEEIKKENGLLYLCQAIRQAHFPDDYELRAQARKRLAFDELFFIQLGALSKKRKWQEDQPGKAIIKNESMIDQILNCLSFALTCAQKRVLNEILSDMEKSKPMSRLLQGEVGSGKTIIAIVALLNAIANGYSGALMAPTGILAEQHFANFRKLLSQLGEEQNTEEGIYLYQGSLSFPVRICQLTGSLSEKEKSALRNKIQSGEVDIVIGTHALIQEDVEFNNLGLVVIDEQHRFGVLQRLALRQKGYNPHMLVMTATPIPRTLALTLYGDLDLSIIDELPPGRQIIQTRWLAQEQRDRAYGFIRRKVNEGEQAFIICPLIEESEAIEAKAAVSEYERLSQEVFPDLKLGLLHGRMSADVKDEVMQHFRDGELDILVSTPVVEVGVDVPNATVMLIEAADRFGLSQLHQFRGRVGRGDKPSYCMLLSGAASVEGRQRLKYMEEIQNGFELAEKDLELRGPGEFFGTRQSGLPELRMAKLSDVQLLEQARRAANSIFKRDPDLKQSEHSLLINELSRVWPNNGEWS
jgi:ATP-dependent DNA helicase RecG